jgi:hypothetical protein
MLAPDSIARDDGNFINIAPLQLGQKVRWIHFARLDEALVTAPLYLDARDLKSACKVRNNRLRLADVQHSRHSIRFVSLNVMVRRCCRLNPKRESHLSESTRAFRHSRLRDLSPGTQAQRPKLQKLSSLKDAV